MYPTLFHIGSIVLPTFGVLAACGLILGLALSQRTARLAGVDADKLWDAGLFAILSAFLLSRLLLIAAHLHTFLQYPVLLLTVPSLTATGLLFTAIATFVWLYFKRIPLLPALDAWAPCATLVWAFLAVGHFCDGSDPGMPTTLRLSVTLRGDDFAQHPVALYAAAAALALTLLLLFVSRRPHARGAICALALVFIGLAQFLLSFLRQPAAATMAGLDPLQFAAVGMILTGTTLWLFAEPAPHSLR